MEVIIAQILIAIATICSAWGITLHQIKEGRKLNSENLKTNEANAGKNRNFYEIELVSISKGKPDTDKSNLLKINEMLNSGKYSIIGAFEVSDVIETIMLGKIHP